jgi:hypothetical protein
VLPNKALGARPRDSLLWGRLYPFDRTERVDDLALLGRPAPSWRTTAHHPIETIPTGIANGKYGPDSGPYSGRFLRP